MDTKVMRKGGGVHAISSLNKYPLPLQNAKEAKILQSFGDGICKILDQKLQRYLRENGPDAPIHSLPKERPLLADRTTTKNAAGDQGKNKGGGGGGRKKREYIPQKRSGGYAVLLTLYRVSQIPGSKGYMFKMELQAEAQQLCDKSFTVPDLGSKYTAWSSVSTLIQKNLVMKTHNPARYSLTEEGLALGERLESLEGTKGPEGDREEARSEGNEEGGQGLVDLTENPKMYRAETQIPGVSFPAPTRSSSVWTSLRQPGQLRTPVGRELVLDYIIERKRMDDLCGSIIDGRFREQKFRLKRCGLRNPCYLVIDRFFVKRVQDVRESMAYLTVMTRYLNKLYQSWRGREDEEEEEREGPPPALLSLLQSSTTCQTVKEVFARQLMQVSGLSGDKAAAILELYSTPLSLLTAYERCAGEADKEKLLSSIRYGKLKRNLGPALSRTVYQLYCTQGALT
ncbi:hypothetical protein F7725_004898 [Dissostichus mawsoni]|uniref:Crossover junction endonuclease MUS81 n=1 Tax=Dissostichus mawsoni TaxID=36200 RepID=A0A7J5XK52_DISMA|nr:hypothetical protein F7725_004898 [Dissostichus mawsoni]